MRVKSKLTALTLACAVLLAALTSWQPVRAGAVADIEVRVLELVNAERAAAGLSALIWNDNAYRAAQIRAKEVLSSFSHTRPDGTNFSTVFAEAGIRYSYAAENIAYGYSSAESVVDAWMNSPGHRANILSERVTYIGVAYVSGGGYSPAWAQEFFSGSVTDSATTTPSPSPSPSETLKPTPTATVTTPPTTAPSPMETVRPTATPQASPSPSPQPSSQLTPSPTPSPVTQVTTKPIYVPGGTLKGQVPDSWLIWWLVPESQRPVWH